MFTIFRGFQQSLRKMSSSASCGSVGVKLEHPAIFVVVRKDLIKTLNWPFGAVINQACHAVSAVVWNNKEDPLIVKYMSDVPNMRKVTLQVKNESQLLSVAAKLEALNITHHLWIEQPENIPTAIATAPYKRSALGNTLKQCQLFS